MRRDDRNYHRGSIGSHAILLYLFPLSKGEILFKCMESSPKDNVARGSSPMDSSVRGSIPKEIYNFPFM
jgi:hypothetical protein